MSHEMNSPGTAAGWLGVLLASLKRAGWAPAGLLAFHLVAFFGWKAYLRLPGLDVPMHVLGGAAASYFVSELLVEAQALRAVGPLPRVVRAWLAFTTTCWIAVFWEFAEWCADRVLTQTVQASLDDTLLDLAMGLVGAGIYVGLARDRAGTA